MVNQKRLRAFVFFMERVYIKRISRCSLRKSSWLRWSSKVSKPIELQIRKTSHMLVKCQLSPSSVRCPSSISWSFTSPGHAENDNRRKLKKNSEVKILQFSDNEGSRWMQNYFNRFSHQQAIFRAANWIELWQTEATPNLTRKTVLGPKFGPSSILT